MSRLIIVSNRLPFSIDKNEGKIRQSSGGLVSAIKSFIEHQQNHPAFTEKLWLGTMDATGEEWQQAVANNTSVVDFQIQPLFVEEGLYNDYYNGFSNSVLWPLFHYFPSLAEYKPVYFEAYKKVNKAFADKLIENYHEGDVIWIHDYHLLLLPQLVREKLPDATIGFFLHIPFPSYEIFRLMPSQWKRSILEGVLGADLIGFHMHDYVQHFIQSAKMILKIENQFSTIQYFNRIIKADLFPIGIDYEKFRKAIINDLVKTITIKLEERFFNQKIIFSVDRLDYTKGLDYRLEGFKLFLEMHPEWLEKVVFILNIVPSRDAIQAYADRKRSIEEYVSTINGKYSTLHWQPIIYRYNHLDFEELCSLYQTADVALITPLRDGMNLVAKEYVASCFDKGVLILSEFTGAANELSEAILVNPTDSFEVADAIEAALTMPLQEQRTRLSFMQKRLKEYDVIKWVNEFLEQLKEVKEEQEKLKVNLLDRKITDEIMQNFQVANNRCILLDYDGTLVPIQRYPSLAAPTPELLDILRQLSIDERNKVVVISGRDSKVLEDWLGQFQITLVAEHGARIKYPNEDWVEQVNVSSEWKEQIKPLMEMFVTRCMGSFIEEKDYTLAWHYRNTHPDLGFVRSRELRNSLLQLITNTPLQVIDGNKVIEVRLIGIDKGNTAKHIIERFQPDFTLCIGDDTTDEDMFHELRRLGYTIKVGTANTAAQYTIPSQSGVLPLLKKFVAIVNTDG
ncbi:MAG: bifunctional alpha,alpha-trehalose-phosphate synthase (UDP-forming)/trehalose-phosphatase [Chitinophagaceae bacterium]